MAKGQTSRGDDGALVPATPAPTARTPASKTPAKARTPAPARTPARLLQQAVESPKTPSLDDVGLSAAALSILQQTQSKTARGELKLAADGSVHRRWLTTYCFSDNPPPPLLSGHGLRACIAAESDSHDSSLDMSSFQISSVPLKTPDAAKSKLNMSVAPAITPAPIVREDVMSMTTTPGFMMVGAPVYGASRWAPSSLTFVPQAPFFACKTYFQDQPLALLHLLSHF